MDLSLFESVNGWAARHDGAEDVLRVFAVYSPEMFAVLIAGLFLARGAWTTRTGRHGALAAALSAGLALVLAKVVSSLVDRPRPFIAHPHMTHLFVDAAHDPGFPSDHVTGSFAIAVAIFLRHRRAGLLALAVAVVVAVARVAVGAHYPGDALGGFVIGSLCALVLWIPPIRRLIDALADRLAVIYDGAMRRVLPA